jgi:hypothetical protein
MLLELTEEDALQVAVILGGEQEKRRYPNIEDAMALSMALLYCLLQGRRHLDATKSTPHSQERRRGLRPLACAAASLGVMDASSSGGTATVSHRELTVAAWALHRPL